MQVIKDTMKSRRSKFLRQADPALKSLAGKIINLWRHNLSLVFCYKNKQLILSIIIQSICSAVRFQYSVENKKGLTQSGLLALCVQFEFYKNYNPSVEKHCCKALLLNHFQAKDLQKHRWYYNVLNIFLNYSELHV